MKTKNIILFLLLFINFNLVALAQKIEWAAYGSNIGASSLSRGIFVDKSNNVYLAGTIGNNGIVDSIQFSGLTLPYLKGAYIIKLDSIGNFNRVAPIYIDMGNLIGMDDQCRLYSPSGSPGQFSIDVYDSTLTLLNTLSHGYTTNVNYITNYYVSRNGTSYISGYYIIPPGQWNYHAFCSNFSTSGNYSTYCNDSVYCSNIYKGDSIGNDFCVYFDRVVTRNGISVPMYQATDSLQVSGFNFNNDSTYSLWGRYNNSGPCLLTADTNYANHLFLSRNDINGNCIWSINFEASLPNSNTVPVFDIEGNYYQYVRVETSIKIGNYILSTLNGNKTDYIIKINKKGFLEWHYPIAVSQKPTLRILYISVDSNKNIYLNGNYFTAVDSITQLHIVNYTTLIMDTTGSSSSLNAAGVFYAKLNQPQNEIVTICPGDSFYFAGSFHKTSGIFYDTLSVNAPNDSIIMLSLTVSPILSNLLQQSNDTLLATATGTTSYKWLDCDSNIVYNFNQPYFIPPHAGNYAAIAQNGSCTDTSACINYVTTSINNLSNAGKVSIYPNPTYTSITINFANKIVPLNTKAVLYDINSKKVMEVAVNTNGQTVNLNKLNQGMYMLTLISDKELFRSMVVKLP